MAKAKRNGRLRNGKAFVGAYVPEELHAKLVAEAQADDRPLSYLVKKILAEGVKHLKQQPLKEAA